MLVFIRGAGDIASGIALRLRHARINVVMSDIPRPTAIRRTVSFSQAIYDERTTVEDCTAVLAPNAAAVAPLLAKGYIAVLVDPHMQSLPHISPDILVDAILAKHNLGTHIEDAPVVIGIGPGFTAGADCHAVIETQRGHTLGRVLTTGSAAQNTGIPGNIGGFTTQRLLRSPAQGIFEAKFEIGAQVKQGEVAAIVNNLPIICQIDGILRGILPDAHPVEKGMKCGDIDPRCQLSHCYTVSDKALAVGGGVLEAILQLSP